MEVDRVMAGAKVGGMAEGGTAVVGMGVAKMVGGVMAAVVRAP